MNKSQKVLEDFQNFPWNRFKIVPTWTYDSINVMFSFKKQPTKLQDELRKFPSQFSSEPHKRNRNEDETKNKKIRKQGEPRKEL